MMLFARCVVVGPATSRAGLIALAKYLEQQFNDRDGCQNGCTSMPDDINGQLWPHVSMGSLASTLRRMGAEFPKKSTRPRRKKLLFTPEEFRDVFHTLGREDQQFISAKIRLYAQGRGKLPVVLILEVFDHEAAGATRRLFLSLFFIMIWEAKTAPSVLRPSSVRTPMAAFYCPRTGPRWFRSAGIPCRRGLLRPIEDTMGAAANGSPGPKGTSMFDPMFPDSKDSDNTGRCVAMTVPQFDGDLPMYRCVRVGTLQIDGRLVCEAHSHRFAAIRWCNQPNN
jgi:hypothetical protein